MKFLYVDECLSCLEYFNYQNHMRLLNSFGNAVIFGSASNFQNRGPET